MSGAEERGTWRAVLGDLQLQVAKPIYDTWLKDTDEISVTDGVLTVGVPTPFGIEWLERRMYQLIQTTAHRVIGRPIDVQFQVGTNDRNNGNGEHRVERRQNTASSSATTPRLNPKYTFDTFVVGPCNRLAYSAACAVAEAPGQVYHPLFLYSGVGLGKTHLLHAIGHTCMASGVTCLYVTCEQFTNEFIIAIRSRTTEEFRAKYRSVDVLLIDDIQFIIGKEQTQEMFFHTFNDLHNSSRQVVLTSDRPPKALSLLEDRLRSRFEWGLLADIQPPNLETRVAILRAKAEQMSLSLPDGILEYIAKKVQKNVRELEGSLNRLASLKQLANGQITPELAAQAVETFTPDLAKQSVDRHTVMAEVTTRLKISVEAIVGTSRRQEIVRARHLVMYLLHEGLGLTDTEIGRFLGGRSHSTVINGVGKMSYEINVDANLRQDVLAIKEALAV